MCDNKRKKNQKEKRENMLKICVQTTPECCDKFSFFRIFFIVVVLNNLRDDDYSMLNNNNKKIIYNHYTCCIRSQRNVSTNTKLCKWVINVLSCVCECSSFKNFKKNKKKLFDDHLHLLDDLLSVYDSPK